MRDQHIMQGRGFGLVYAITMRSSFNALKALHSQILRVKDEEKCPVVVIGNQCDLDKSREVPTQEAKEFAKSINAPFFETSGNTDHHQLVLFNG